jgi:hypothetical protein
MLAERGRHDDDPDDEDPPEARDPNMHPLPDHNIPTYAHENGAYT